MFKLFGKKAEVEVTTDRNSYLPGETVTAHVKAEVLKDIDVREAKVALVHRIRYTYREDDSDPDGGGTEEHRAVNDVVVASANLAEPGKLPKGFTVDRDFQLTLPSESQPTSVGKIMGSTWVVKALFDVPHGTDPAAEASIAVLALESTNSARERVEANSTVTDIDMNFPELSSRSLRPGDKLTGKFRMAPQSDTKVKQLTVHLASLERVTRAKGNRRFSTFSQMVVARDLDLKAGQAAEYDFELVLPSDAVPCVQAAQAGIFWFVQAIVERPMFKKDAALSQNLNVYNSTGVREVLSQPVTA